MADLPPSASRWRYLDMPLAIPLRLGFELEDNNDDLGTATAAWVVDNRAPAGPAKTVASGRVRAMASRSRSVSVLTVPVNRIVAVVWCLCSVAGEFGTASSEPAGDAPIDTPFVFVTAASENHACPLLEMLQSLLWQAPRTPVVGKRRCTCPVFNTTLFPAGHREPPWTDSDGHYSYGSIVSGNSVRDGNDGFDMEWGGLIAEVA